MSQVDGDMDVDPHGQNINIPENQAGEPAMGAQSNGTQQPENMDADSGNASINANPNPVADPAPGAANADIAALIALCTQQQAALTTIFGNLSNGAQTNPTAKVVRAVDIKLEHFSGGAKSASILHADQLIEFDKWYHMSVHRMRMYNLPEKEYAACLIANLDGPARASWFSKFPDTMHITAKQFYEDFCSLIPHYKLFCSTQYTSMVFAQASLVDDVDRFISYVRFSGTMPDLNVYHEIVCDMFYQKLSQSCAHLIQVARTTYGIDLKATDPLKLLADNVKAAARRYILDYPTQQKDRSHSKPLADNGAGPSNIGGQKESWKTVVSRKKRKEKEPDQSGDNMLLSMAKLSDNELLERFHRCKKCAYKPKMDSKTGELADHKICDPSQKEKRLEAIRRDLMNKKNPNEFPPPKKAKSGAK